MNLSSILGRIKAAINPQTAEEPTKPLIPAPTEEFQVIPEPIQPIAAKEEIPAEEIKPEIAAQESKPIESAPKVGTQEKPVKELKTEVVKGKKPSRSKKELSVKSPANQEQIANSNVISDIKEEKTGSIRDLVESASGSLSQSDTQLSQPENTGELRGRDESGKWLPGYAPNPGGRPKIARLTEAYKHILETDGAETYARVIANIAVTGKKDSDRISAVQEIADRVEGKAVQNTNVRGVMVMIPAETVSNALDNWADDGQ